MEAGERDLEYQRKMIEFMKRKETLETERKSLEQELKRLKANESATATISRG